MTPREDAAKHERVDVRALTLPEIEALPPIASGYTTDRIYRLSVTSPGSGTVWKLDEHTLSHPILKQYDNGAVEDWLPMYRESVGESSIHFTGAYIDGDLVGLATWSVSLWNKCLWLADIRVRGERRWRGVGSRLVGHVKNESRRRSLRGVRVETQTINFPAIKFYRRHGFTITGFDEHLYVNDGLHTDEIALFLFWNAG